MKSADQLVLDALYRETHGWISNAEWLGVVKAVEEAGSIEATTGFPRDILVKAARSFGGDRSAAGRYAAQMRWSRSGGSGSGKVESGYLSEPKRATPKPPPTHAEVYAATNAAKQSVADRRFDDPMRQKVQSADTAAHSAMGHDKAGRKLDAWERASTAAFDADVAAKMQGAPKAVKLFAEVLARMVLHLTDKYHSREAA